MASVVLLLQCAAHACVHRCFDTAVHETWMAGEASGQLCPELLGLFPLILNFMELITMSYFVLCS